MEIGISTATLFGRQYNEDAVVTLKNIGARVAEIFLESYCEYTDEYGTLLNERKGDLKVHSIHTLNTHFEPQLFSENERALNDALKIFENCLSVGKILGAKCYTLHGKAKFKRNMVMDNYDRIGHFMNILTDISKKYGMQVCLENVEWAYYSRPGFFSRVREFCPDLRGCLDVKQARVSGYECKDYIADMGSAISTVHLSDVDKNGKIVLPAKGVFDFEGLFEMLDKVGFKGNCLIEVYKESFTSIGELTDSLEYLRKINNK